MVNLKPFIHSRVLPAKPTHTHNIVFYFLNPPSQYSSAHPHHRIRCRRILPFLLENCFYSSWRFYPTPTSSCLLLAWFGLLPFDKKCLYTWIAFTMSSCIITPYHNLQSPTGDHQSHHRAVGHVVWSTTNGEISTESTIRIEI